MLKIHCAWILIKYPLADGKLASLPRSDGPDWHGLGKVVVQLHIPTDSQKVSESGTITVLINSILTTLEFSSTVSSWSKRLLYVAYG
jgi:hypothetical protein